MRVQHWCMLGVTILLLVCQVTFSQLCKSLITLVDGFHTFFILMRMALPSIKNSPLSSLDYTSPLRASSSSSSSSSSAAGLPSTQPAESSVEPAAGTHVDEAVDCCVSYSCSRIQPVGAFISALILTSLCLSYLMEITSFSLKPHPVQRPLLLVVVGAVSLLHKVLLLWLNWDQLQDEQARAGRQSQTVVKHKEETKGHSDPGRLQDDADNTLHNGALVLCNPGASSIPDTDPQTGQEDQGVHVQDSRDCEAAGVAADWKVCKCESCCGDVAEISRDNVCMGHDDSQRASNAPVCNSSHQTESEPGSQRKVSLLSFILIIQSLCTSILALINSLVVVLVGPQCLHSSGSCGLLVYLDPFVSLLAVNVLVATAAPQVHRYGLLLLQATPPSVCVSDLGRRITSVPGVQAVHNLHVWQLTESFMVASVHVHCHDGFPAHRCGDLMSGVTKILQSVGVSCCTIQPEFASCSESPAGGEEDASPIVHREDPSGLPLLTCSLACEKACAEDMCCSPTVEETSLQTPPPEENREEMKEETLVIENTFL